MSWSGTSTLLHPTSMTPGGLKWSQGCSSSGELSLQWTPRWSVPCRPMVLAGAAQHDGVAAEAALLRKARTCTKLVGTHRRAHLGVLALKVGGRWSRETQAFVTQLARTEARGETQLVRRRAGNRRGVSGGDQLGHARPWLQPCWSCRELVVPMAIHVLHMRWSGSVRSRQVSWT